MGNEYFAISEIDGAIQRTKTLLWPFNLGIWLRLAVLSLFVGGGGGFSPNIFQYQFDELPSEFGQFQAMGPGIPGNLFIILLIVGIIIAVAFIFWIIASIFQFVFVDSLSSGNISLSRTFGERTGKGIRLLLFELGLIILFIAVLAVLALIFLGPIIFGLSTPRIPIIASLLLVIPLLIILILILAIIQLFTIDFVVPAMIRDDSGVLDGWRSIYRLLSTNWTQSLVYLVAKVLLSIASAIVLAILVILTLLIIAIPFAVVAMAIITFTQIMPWFLVILLIPFIIIAIPAILFLSVPFTTFFRYYSLLVLGRYSTEYALLPPEQPETPAT